MPKYRIEQYELSMSTHEVDAKDEAEAIEQMLDGNGHAIDDSHEYIETCETAGQILRGSKLFGECVKRGIIHADLSFIPSIRSIEEIDDNGE